MEKENSVTSLENSTFSHEIGMDYLDLLDTMFGANLLDYNNTITSTPSIFDLLQTTPALPPPQFLAIPSSPTFTFPESLSDVIDILATPNLSSISSSSTEAADDYQQSKTVKNVQHDEEQDQDKYKKQLKPKQKNQKREREPRFAFMTKSEVDHLDDGFRWRKYGQKTLKNSPFPRSYYRCTTASCGLKKRVERSIQDPSIVVTTYEGTHTHHCPVTPRGYTSVLPRTTTYGGAIIDGGNSTEERTYYGDSSLFSTNNNSLQEKRFWNSSSYLAKDYGLLQDMVSSHTGADVA